MTVRAILEYPDPRLRRKAVPVDQVDAQVRQLMDDMLDTMYAANGIGLAAPQVDSLERVIVIDLSKSRDAPLVLANPEIITSVGVVQTEEGCLSVPDIYEKVERAERIGVRGRDRDGAAVKLDVDGLLAVAIQHEIDHLDGKIFVDYLSELKRQMIKRRFRKQRAGARDAPTAVPV